MRHAILGWRDGLCSRTDLGLMPVGPMLVEPGSPFCRLKVTVPNFSAIKLKANEIKMLVKYLVQGLPG